MTLRTIGSHGSTAGCRRSARSWSGWLPLVLLVGGGSSALQAQSPIAQFQEAMDQAAAEATTRGLGDTLRVNPAVAVVDVTKQTVMVEITNVGADTIGVNGIQLLDVPPPRPQVAGAGLLLAPGSEPAPATPNANAGAPSDSLRPVGSLAAWIREFPKADEQKYVPGTLTLPCGYFCLAPGATRTLVLQFTVPPNVAPGDYATYLVLHITPFLYIDLPSNWAPWLSQKGLAGMDEDTPGWYPYAVTRLVYRASR